MCHTITRTLCTSCTAQIGDVEIKPAPSCFPPVARPAWGSGLSMSRVEQHRGKRIRRLQGLCDQCRARTAAAAAASASSPEASEAGSPGGSGEGSPGGR